jgi:chemosensory pili system protein ChpE
LIAFIISSAILGIAFCAPPGVVTAEAVRRGLARGFWAALFLELGSLIGDAAWAIIALVGAAFVLQNIAARLILGLAGSLLLLYLAWNAFSDARRDGMPQSRDHLQRSDFLTGAFLSLGNPFTIAFWLGVGNTAVSSRISNPQPVHFVVFFVSFMLGALVYCFIIAGLIAWGERYVTARFFRWVNIVCGLFLTYFGSQLLWSLFQSILNQ